MDTTYTIDVLATLTTCKLGDSEYSFKVFCALADLKNDDPELFDGSRSLDQLIAMLPPDALK